MDRRKFIEGTMLAAVGGVAAAHADGRIIGDGVIPNAVADEPAKTGMHKFSKMRTITLEEHYVSPAFAAGPWKSIAALVCPPMALHDSLKLGFWPRLQDLGAGRLALMDEADIDVQILSHFPGIEQLEANEQVPMVRDTNDYLKETVAKYPTRYARFRKPMHGGARRGSQGTGADDAGGLQGRHHQRPQSRPLPGRQVFLADAGSRRTPGCADLPASHSPPKAVFDYYYSVFSPKSACSFSMAGCGWHIETGIHVTRMILGGVFDQFPNLKIVIGHMGEGLPFWLPRMDRSMGPKLTKLKQPISAYLRQNVYYTFSGFNFLPNFINLMSQVGVEDRIMFSTDYPFGSMLEARTSWIRCPSATPTGS